MKAREKQTALGLLLLRVSLGAMMLFGHGLGKYQNFAKISAGFPDPLGVGSEYSLMLAVFAEVLCAAALCLGLFSRLCTIPLIVTMLIALFVIHSGDPWAKQELAALYLCGYLSLLIMGPGDYSLDRFIWKKRILD